jgi:CYTH domain-containing protein
MKKHIKNIIIALLSVAVVVLIIIPLLNSEPVSATVSREQIKRTYLVDIEDLPWELLRSGSSRDLIQAYVSYSPEIRIRSTNDQSFHFTMKLPLDDMGLARTDIEFEISREEYDVLFGKISGNVIHKTRYRFNEDGIDIRVDIFLKELTGLIFAEVEFDSVLEANAFIPPAWFGLDVTYDDSYKNAMLSRDGMPE